MATLRFKLIPEDAGLERPLPLNIALMDVKGVRAARLSQDEAIRAVAREIAAPVGINIFDLDAVTTTSDGIVVEGAIVRIAAGDRGKVHAEFGILPMAPMPVTDALLAEEPHLLQIPRRYPGRRLFRGPNPRHKRIPVHNAAMTGRAVNNNSGTEMMNVVTMEEILLPILGQLELMRGAPVVIGRTGEHISVGIGMTVAEKYGRIFPFRQFRAGDTAHACGKYSKGLKKDIPCIVAPKAILAAYLMRAFDDGMIAGLHLGCAPAVIVAAQALGKPIRTDLITPAAREELLSVGVDADRPPGKGATLSPAAFIARAEELIPGVDEPRTVEAKDLVREITLTVQKSP